MRDIIFISMENWDDIWRRNQFLCAGLTRRFPGVRILFVGIHRDLTYVLRSGNMKHLLAKAPLHPGGFENITFIRPLKFLPTKFSLGRRFNEWTMRRMVSRWSRRLGFSGPVLWINGHYAADMVGKMVESQVVYDITDDWTQFTQTPALRQLTIEQDAALCRRADHVIVCSQKLLEDKTPLCRDLHLVPNGVEIEHYASVLDAHLPVPEAANAWPKPVLGYTGTAHPDRVDVDLVEKIARRMKQGSVVFVGPNQLPETDRQRLAACGNFIMHGPVPYRDIPAYMRAFDVCITPHCVTPFTESLNPIKLWEYLAAGKPIVATPVAGFRDYPEHVYLAGDAEEFLAAVEAALAEPPAKRLARQAEVAAHSWEARVQKIAAILGSQGSPSPMPEAAIA